MVLVRTKKKTFYQITVIAFHRNNVIKINFVREEKVHILTKEVNAKKILEIKAKKMSALKRPIFGHSNSDS